MSILKPTILTIAIWILLLFSLQSDIEFIGNDIVRATLLLFAFTSTVILFKAMSIDNNRNHHTVKITTVPEFKLKDVKFYELSLILDGTIDKQDLLALLTFYTLFPPENPDEVEEIILSYASSHTISVLYRMHFKNISTEEENDANLLGDFTRSINNPIWESAKKHNFFKYSIRQINTIIFILAGLSAVLFGLFVSQNLEPILFSLTISTSLTALLLSVYSKLLYENFENLKNVKQKALGYRMYLKTVEWYTVEKSTEKLEKYMPYFILYGLKREKFDYMITHIQEKLQVNTSNAIFG